MAEHEATTTPTAAKILTKAAIERAWNDVDAKIIAGLGGGGLVTLAVYVASLYNFTLSPWELTGIGALGVSISGYLKKSTLKVPTAADSAAAATQALGTPAADTDDDTPVSFDPIVTPPAAPPTA